MKLIFLFCLLITLIRIRSAPVEGPGRLDDLPNIEMFQPEKKQNVPIKAGEYRKWLTFKSLGCIPSFEFHV
jgi:hypothetical protein